MMTQEQKSEITNMSIEFQMGIGIPINKSEWLVVDPLSSFLNASGYKNTLQQMPAKDGSMVLVITFKDGTQFIPAGDDLNYLSNEFKNWMFID